MIHTLPLERRTLSGYFSKDVEPALRIADGLPAYLRWVEQSCG